MNPKSIKSFYNKFPYPNFTISSIADLVKLPSQQFFYNLTKLYCKTGNVLDAGCGTGELALVFSHKGYKSFGIDITEKPLEIARKVAKKLTLPVSFKKMDVLKLKYPKDFFDVTIANGVLHHTKNPLLGFENLVRVTKPEGIIIIVLYNKYGSLARKFFGKAVDLLVGGANIKGVTLIRKLTGKKYASVSDSVIADTFFNPYETSFSIGEVFGWFNKYGIEYLESAPPIEISLYPSIITNVFKNKSPYQIMLDARSSLPRSNPGSLSSFLVQLLWLVTAKGNVFLIIGKKH